tara:strand:- start:33 stop:446 length:414 start_codon:yes stop_codon:yes gene_type:complete
MARIHCQKCEAFLTVDQTHIDEGLCDMCWPYRDVPRLHKEQMEGDKRYCTVCGDGDLAEYYIFPDCNPGMDYFCNDHEPKNMTFMNTTDTYPEYVPGTVPTTIVRIDEWSILIPTFQQMYDYSEKNGGDLAYHTTRD